MAAISFCSALHVDGVLVDAQLDARQPPGRAQGSKDLYEVDRAARKIMERHTGGEELRRIHIDDVETGRKLGVDMPVLALQPFVEAFAEKPHVTTGQ